MTTSVFAVIFCYFLAMGIVFCVPERYQRLFLVLAILPFWSSYILRLFAWQLILAQKGVLNYVLGGLGLDDPLIITNTQIGTRIGLIYYLSPILIIILYITLINVNRNLIEAARELGATRLQAFWRVIVPLSRRGLTFAFGFVGIVSFGDVLSGMLVGGWLLAFTFSFDEFIIAWFVSGFDQTLPVAVYNVMIASHDPSLNAIGTIVFGLLLLTLLGAELLIIPLFMRRRTAR